MLPLDVQDDAQVAAAVAGAAEALGGLDILVHAVAYARPEDLGGRFVDTGREGFHLALDVSAYSLAALAREAEPHMRARGGGSIMTLSYIAGDRAVPGYNVMGVAKAALESIVRYLAWDLGDGGIRVNAISAGPVRTLAARGIPGFGSMADKASERAPLRRDITAGRGRRRRPLPGVAVVGQRHRRDDVRRCRVPRHGVLTGRRAGPVRIGVVADTHVGENLPELPAEVCEVLAGVNLILHAGDIIDPAVLDALRAVAPVVAVRGNHDERRGHRELPRDVLVRVGGARIGLTHGHRRASVELPAIAVSLVAGRPVRLGFERTMRGRFPGADCVVVGHLHEPIHHEVARRAPVLARLRLLGRARPRLRLARSPGDGLSPLPPPAARRGPPAGRGPDRGGPGVLRARVIPLLRPIRAAA